MKMLEINSQFLLHPFISRFLYLNKYWAYIDNYVGSIALFVSFRVKCKFILTDWIILFFFFLIFSLSTLFFRLKINFKSGWIRNVILFVANLLHIVEICWQQNLNDGWYCILYNILVYRYTYSYTETMQL